MKSFAYLLVVVVVSCSGGEPFEAVSEDAGVAGAAGAAAKDAAAEGADESNDATTDEPCEMWSAQQVCYSNTDVWCEHFAQCCADATGPACELLLGTSTNKHELWKSCADHYEAAACIQEQGQVCGWDAAECEAEIKQIPCENMRQGPHKIPRTCVFPGDR